MPFGIPRTDEERRIRHEDIYGPGTSPPRVRRGLGPSTSNLSETIGSWMPSPIKGPDGKFQLPLPKWATVRMRGSGRRL